LQLGDYQLVEFLSGTKSEQLCLACFHLESIAGHQLLVSSFDTPTQEET